MEILGFQHWGAGHTEHGGGKGHAVHSTPTSWTLKIPGAKPTDQHPRNKGIFGGLTDQNRNGKQLGVEGSVAELLDPTG